MREPEHHLTFFQALEEQPFQHDFYQAVRRIECAYPELPRIGKALRPADEPVRFGQEASMNFAPASIASFCRANEAGPARMQVRFFGLLGPNGPLPHHLTEFARARAQQAGDPTLLRFLDLLHHRFIALFYRAWAQAQPSASLDRPQEDRFSFYTGALCGIGDTALRQRDAVNDHAKLFFTGLLARQVRNRDGLVALLSGYFRLPIDVEEHVGHWMTLDVRDRSRLGHGTTLGGTIVLGNRVWDCQHKIRIRIGPVSLALYESFLPGGSALARLTAWVRQYLNFELDWDVRLVLQREQVPACRPGSFGRLGWTTWLGKYRRGSDAADLTLDPERLLSGAAVPAVAY